MAGDHGSLTTRARVLIVGAGLLIAVAGVFAVARSPGAGGCMDEMGIPGFAGGGRYPIFEDLDLTAGQREAWVGAWQTHLDEMRPTLDRLQELRRDLHAELASESPD